MLSRTLKAVLLLCLIASVAFAGYNWPAASKSSQPILVGAPQGWAHTDEDSSIFFENFESGWGEWTTVDVTAAGIQWHHDTFNAYAGDSWWCGDPLIPGYDNHWLQYLITPTLDFSNVTNPVLTFKLYYCVEDPAGATAPYDGWDGSNVWLSTDNGVNWNVITPTFPAYERQSLYSFGLEWGMGPNIPGWCGASGGPADTTWVDAQFSLSGAVGNSQVKLRFAFCSDPAYSSIGNPGVIGLFVDDVSIDDGGTNLLSNNADDPPYPSEFTFEVGGTSGDWWILDTQTYHSASHCATCVIENHYNLSNALVTPWIYIPMGYTTYYTFWLWCDMLDFTGGGGTTLEDYYVVEGTTDGVVWLKDEFGFHDYGDAHRPGGATVGWEEYLPGDPYNGNVQLDLSAYAGQDIKLRWRVITDDNDDGGIGSGMHVDDFNVWASSTFNNDVGATDMHIPFPTSLSNSSVTGTVTLYNFGNLNQPSVPAFARRDSSSLIPLAPWANIPSLTSVDKTFNWSLTAIGDFYWDAYTQLLGDEDPTNDTTSASYVTVTPEHVYELGYDARQYLVNPYYYFSFDPGNGAMCRFVPADHVIPEPVDIVEAKMMFQSAGACVFHLYDAGTASQPGAELYSTTLNVNMISPNWMTVDLSAVTQMIDRTEPFWIWVESLSSTMAQITGDDAMFGGGHYFTYNGSSASPTTLYEFYIRVMAEESQGAPPEIAVNLTPENPPIFIPGSGGSFNFNIAVSNNTASPSTFDVWTMATLPNGHAAGPLVGPVTVTVPPLTTIDRDRTQAVGFGAPAGAYTYDAYVGDYRLQDIWDEDHFDFTKLADDNGGPIVPEWANWGESFDDLIGDASALTPDKFALHAAYPNPFNPETSLTFDLPEAGHASLVIYDINGREIVRLADGWRAAGTYQITFDASGLSSGVYFARLQMGDSMNTQKLLLLK